MACSARSWGSSARSLRTKPARPVRRAPQRAARGRQPRRQARGARLDPANAPIVPSDVKEAEGIAADEAGATAEETGANEANVATRPNVASSEPILAASARSAANGEIVQTGRSAASADRVNSGLHARTGRGRPGPKVAPMPVPVTIADRVVIVASVPVDPQRKKSRLPVRPSLQRRSGLRLWLERPSLQAQPERQRPTTHRLRQPHRARQPSMRSAPIRARDLTAARTAKAAVGVAVAAVGAIAGKVALRHWLPTSQWSNPPLQPRPRHKTLPSPLTGLQRSARHSRPRINQPRTRKASMAVWERP